jgi:hypothetical protein
LTWRTISISISRDHKLMQQAGLAHQLIGHDDAAELPRGMAH